MDDGSPRPPRAYCQRGAGRDLSPKEILAISALDNAHANKIFDLLLREYGINIGDRADKWALLHKEYAFNPDVLSFVLDKDVLIAIEKRLGERILRRKRWDFNVAEDIHDELRDEYVVEIDDPNKEWMVVAPRGGRWPKDNDRGRKGR